MTKKSKHYQITTDHKVELAKEVGMALFYITGISGTGKSTVRDYLEKMGYTAYDADYDDICHWKHRQTGSVVSIADASAPLSKTWLEEYEWRMARDRVEALAAEAKDKPVFLCGTSAHDADFHDLLEGVVFLTIDEETVRQRLASRQTNPFGKTPDELDHALRWRESAEEYYREFGAKLIDATAVVEQVVEQILDFALQSEPAVDRIEAVAS